MTAYHPDFLRQIIRVALQPVSLWSYEAEELLLLTDAHESHLGRYLLQLPNGPARGLYQMEPTTEVDIWHNYLGFRPHLTEAVGYLTGVTGPDLGQLQFNPIYNTVMARLLYKRVPHRLPSFLDIDGMAAYAKEHYNTALGSATANLYANDYKRFVLA